MKVMLISFFILQVRDSAVHDVAAVVFRCLKPAALFVCRSCNHSLDELQTIFARDLDLEFYDDSWCVSCGAHPQPPNTHTPPPLTPPRPSFVTVRYGVLLTVWRKPAS